MNKFRKKGALVPALLLCLALALTALPGCGDRAEPAPEKEIASGKVTADTDGSSSAEDSDDGKTDPSENSDAENSDAAPDCGGYPPISHTFFSLQSIDEFRRVWQTGDEDALIAFAERETIAKRARLANMFTMEEADSVMALVDTLPVPILGGEMELIAIEFHTWKQYTALLFKNPETKDDIFFMVKHETTEEEALEKRMSGVKQKGSQVRGGYTIQFFVDSAERDPDNVWNTRGLFVVNGREIQFTFGNSEQRGETDLARLTAPLESLTISTIAEQIDIEMGNKQK